MGMRTIPRFLKWLLAAGSLGALLCGSSMSDKSRPFVVHEWGTFTSVQGADGVLLDWRPLHTSVLPKFVYDWTKPGLNRKPTAALLFGKGGVVALQRMETPVLYFYAAAEQTVDVSVKFPKGLITEWYPQAQQIGPSSVPAPPIITALDRYAHKAGAKPEFTFARMLENNVTPDSRARWMNVKILPATQYPALAGVLPQDPSGSHYFSARATDSDYVQIASLGASKLPPENEKFIFYRGVGNFTTPLSVTMDAEHLTLTNTGPAPLAGVLLLTLDHGAGNFISIGQLGPGEKQSVPTSPAGELTPVHTLSDRLGDAMAQTLVNQGLYPREARAMVETWKDSWFEEDGVRILYVLPRVWTDQTLPLALDPAPRELVRVMVGRCEVLTSALEHRLRAALVDAAQGDAAARAQVVAEFKRLGRFAQPAFALAARNSGSEATQIGWSLLEASAN